jgi:hypothetical protein
MKIHVKLLLMIAGISLLTACSKSDQTFENDLNVLNQGQKNQKASIVRNGTVALQGYTRFAFSAPKEGVVITDGYSQNFLECTAELVFGDNQTFVLNTKEVVPGLDWVYREVSFSGKITPSGELKFSWPESWIELGALRTDILSQVREHTGMTLSGQGINKNTLVYMGSFRKGKLFADMHIMGMQQMPGTMPFFAEIVDGPVLINFMIDLEVNE